VRRLVREVAVYVRAVDLLAAAVVADLDVVLFQLLVEARDVLVPEVGRVGELVQLGDLDAPGFAAGGGRSCDLLGAQGLRITLRHGRCQAPGMSDLCSALMDDSPERAFLAQLEERLAEGDQVEVEVSLVLLAGRGVELDEDELKGARRRAVE